MIGNLPQIVKAGRHEAFHRWARQFGPVFKVFEGAVVSVVVQEPALAKWINSRMPNRHPIPYLESGEEEMFNAAGILFSRDAYHRGLAAAWQPMFHSKRLEGFMGIMDDATMPLLKELEIYADSGQVVDIWPLFGDLTLRVSGSTAFGTELSNLATSSKAFLDAAGQIENIYALLQIMFPPLAPVFRRIAAVFPTPTYAAGLAGRRRVRDAVTALLQEHRSGNVPGGSSFLNFMSRSVNKDTGRPFSDMQVVCQAFSFVLAAYETSASALSFVIYLLACHPEEQNRVVSEIEKFDGKKKLEAADLQTQFPRLEAVVKETLRLYPPVALTIREADRDIELPDGKGIIPVGTHLCVSVFGLHRDPEFWEQPNEFRPERFLRNEQVAAYMPFGDGTRGCIGQKYAWQELMLVLVRVMQRFEFSLETGTQGAPSELPVRMALGLTPSKGVRVLVSRKIKRG